MSGGSGRGVPPADTRFRRGQSGNPRGRPRKPDSKTPSAFDVVIEKSLTVVQNGRAREVTIDEALQHRTYQDAIAGNLAARREVLKMIAKREQALAKRQPRVPAVEVKMEGVDPRNAEAALLILDIARIDASRASLDNRYKHLLLEPWAVKAALARRRGARLNEREIAEIKRCTRDADALRWPGKATP